MSRQLKISGYILCMLSIIMLTLIFSTGMSLAAKIKISDKDIVESLEYDSFFADRFVSKPQLEIIKLDGKKALLAKLPIWMGFGEELTHKVNIRAAKLMVQLFSEMAAAGEGFELVEVKAFVDQKPETSHSFVGKISDYMLYVKHSITAEEYMERIIKR